MCLWAPRGAAEEGTTQIVADAAADRIAEIRFVGNRVTRPKTMLQEMYVGPGDPVDFDRIEQSRQAIMDLGLFKTVKADVLPSDAGAVLYVTVEEKHYLFPLPSLSRTGDGDLSYGFDIDWANVLGRNIELDVGVERKTLKGADVDEERTFGIDVIYPRIWGSPWEVEVNLDLQKSFLDEERDGRFGEFEEDSEQVRVVASRWKVHPGPSKGWRYRVGTQWKEYKFDFISGDPTLFFDATEVRLLGGIEYIDVQEFEFSNAGIHYGYNIQVSSESLGSDGDFVQHSLFYRRLLPLKWRPHTNFNYLLRFSTVNDTLFGDPAFDLGGSGALRGYDREVEEGNVLLLANTELLTPIFGRDTLRGVLLFDAGNVYEDFDSIELGDLRYSAGIGLRWKLRSFVRTDLRLDIAHGFSDGGETKVYAATRATF